MRVVLTGFGDLACNGYVYLLLLTTPNPILSESKALAAYALNTSAFTVWFEAAKEWLLFEVP